MTYIFEDTADELMCQIFNMAYDDDVKEHFLYTNSSGKIEKALKKLIDEKEDTVFIYLDVQPDNRLTVIEYSHLIREYQDKFKYFMIFPIPCREYYYIKSLQDTNRVRHQDWVNTVLNREWFRNSQMLNNDQIRQACRNFENFCKQVQKRAFTRCTNNIYWSEDCLCTKAKASEQFKSINDCQQNTLGDKVSHYVEQFICFPAGSKVKNHCRLDWGQIKRINHMLVDDYTKQMELYKKMNTDETCEYYDIEYIQDNIPDQTRL